MMFSHIKRLTAMLILPAVLIASGFLFTAMADDTTTQTSLSGSRMFFLSADDAAGGDASSIAAFAAENGYTHIVARYSDSADDGVYKKLGDAAKEKGAGVLLLAGQDVSTDRLASLLKSGSFSGAALEAGDDVAAAGDTLKLLYGKGADVPLGVYVSESADEFGQDGAGVLSELAGDGMCDFVIARDICSSYAENGFAEELAAWRTLSGDLTLIIAGDIGRVLSPVVSGDFFGDVYELNYQYEISRNAADGFAVLDYSALKKNAYGTAASLSAEFADSGLSTLADSLEIPQTLSITRPTGADATVTTQKYTIFGTSDPSQTLYLDGVEVERTGTAGLFAVQVSVSVGVNSYTFTQGGTSAVAVLRRTDSSEVSTISKITTGFPYYQEGVHVGDKVTLSCVAPSGGSVTANVDGQYVELTQSAATAYDGVPATFKAEFTFAGSGDHASDETLDVGSVVYNLTYNGTASSYTTAGTFVKLADGSDYVVKCVNALSGVEKNAADEGNYITTLKPGCEDVVTGSDGDWWQLSCGGYIHKKNVEAVTGTSPSVSNTISAFAYGSDERGDYLDISCSVLPAFKTEWSARAMSIVLYNTSGSAPLDSFPGGLFARASAFDGGSGTVTLSFVFSEATWGYDIETNEDSSVLRVYIRRSPVLSENLSKPLDGIVVVLDAGHGGIDPGALSVAGTDGVTEADINNANALAVKDLLERLGASVTYNYATGDDKLEFPGRMDPAEDLKTDIYISFHSNSVAESADSNLYYGTEVYYYTGSSARLARLLAENISDATGRDNEGAHQSYYRVTRMDFAPSVLVECGYVSNPRELEELVDPLMIEKTATAVVRSVMTVLGG
mgnify:CR=1 FL=1